uniref:Uncharacterized protein n=1 Tax=Archaeoglobus fulgidus TaxID=2234 RepID=A0A7J2TLD1_ARCFL
MKVAVLILIIAASQACVFEIRSAVFYPNGTQEISRDWLIVDFENNYGYEIFDVDIGDIAKLPVVRNGERVKVDPYKNLTPRDFPLIVRADIKTFPDRSEVEYSIRNLGKPVKIEISIPIFRDFISCEKCEVLNESIVFRKEFAENETANFTISTSRQFSIPDATISFSYEDSIPLNFTASIPVSIEKGRSNKWIGIFNITNTIDKEADIKATALVEFQNGSRIELFNESFRLEAGKSFTRSAEVVSDDVPIFILKMNARVLDFCMLRIIPAYEINGRYVVGQALLKGISYFPPVPFLPFMPTPEIPTLPTPPAETPVSREFIEGGTIRIIIPERIPKEITFPNLAVTFFSLAGLFIVTVFFPVRSRRGIVAIRKHEKVARIFFPKFRIYCPPSSPLSFGIMVEPDEETVSALLANGLSRDYAEAIAVAAKVKKPLIVDREDVARIALSLGIPVIAYGKLG